MTTMVSVPGYLEREAFGHMLGQAASERETRRARLDRLAKETRVTVYTFGMKGADLARQLRLAGLDCVIFDNAPLARQQAREEGFEVASALPRGLPVIVAAGQHQVEIVATLDTSAYTLPEALYAFELRNAYGPMHDFVHMVSKRADDLFCIYQQLEPMFRRDFLAVLLFRASLDVGYTNGTRLPLDEMWAPPVEDLESFCDVGAYDGDTLRFVRSRFPRLSRSFTVEPNPAHVVAIEEAARHLKIENRHFAGAAWCRPARLTAELLDNGMFVMREAEEGDLAGEPLDVVAAGATYDYLKFDVEGTEKQALQGASKLLRGARMIAVAAYHLPEDIVHLPGQLDQILGPGDDWHWGFRHYSQCFDDSIFYFYRAARETSATYQCFQPTSTSHR
jgi:FkbM family methyltransferase